MNNERNINRGVYQKNHLGYENISGRQYQQNKQRSELGTKIRNEKDQFNASNCEERGQDIEKSPCYYVGLLNKLMKRFTFYKNEDKEMSIRAEKSAIS